MLLSVIKYFRGYVHVKLTGYAPERFLNLCGNRNILIWNLKPCENGYTFCISVDAFRQLKPILKKTKTQIRIQKRVGMPFCAFRYRRRYLFPAGLLFFCFLLYDLSGFIWNIEINGNSYLTTETILDFLEEEHASFGTRKSRTALTLPAFLSLQMTRLVLKISVVQTLYLPLTLSRILPMMKKQI